jgi:hypothetical protein
MSDDDKAPVTKGDLKTIVGIGIAILLFATNPGKRQFEKHISDEYNLNSEQVSRDDYLLFSIHHIKGYAKDLKFIGILGSFINLNSKDD